MRDSLNKTSQINRKVFLLHTHARTHTHSHTEIQKQRKTCRISRLNSIITQYWKTAPQNKTFRKKNF